MQKLVLLLFALSIYNLLFAQSTDTITFSIVSAGKIKGFDKEWKNTDGSYTNWYQYNDRGRGDSLITVYKEDEQGFPTYIKAAGKDYMKNDVSEEFSLVNDHAKWKNNAEDEEKSITGKMFYSGLKSSGGHLIKALRANGNKIDLLPFGQAQLKMLQKHNIGNGNNRREIWLIEMKGFGLTPSYSWIDKDNNSFAWISEWRSSILKGYETYIDELLTIQKNMNHNFTITLLQRFLKNLVTLY